MKIVLTADVDNLGVAGDIVEVKDGYARNYLLPKHVAIVATPGAEKQVENIARARQSKQIRDMEHANEVKQAIEKIGNVSHKVKTANNGKLFGSVNVNDAVLALRQAGGPAVDKRVVVFTKGHIKSVGKYQVEVKLHKGVVARYTLVVEPISA